ncbi:hypothetical protein JHL18_21170 [Clostridium sp. YIM B02505]|uniref:Fibronectin type-III domain-containing protein n=1 Tax=Clostridium yunnanense TaxID=2800325 RepID=A0ABS1EUS5_9CLOT|nr:hypothetical protein [Clostridium yunnanense]MBK1813136.1 hypothetical protein [Clostridium yunnanense]
MDDFIVRGEEKESVLDNDRVIHDESYAVVSEDNASKVDETHSHHETRNEQHDLHSIDEDDNEGMGKGSLRENMQSITGIFASVAVTAVVAVTVAFSDAPVVNIASFDVGKNYVEYSADINNETGKKLLISVSSDDKTYEKEVDTGTVSDMVKDLKPDKKYTFSIKAVDGIKRTFLTKSFRTMKSEKEYEPKISGITTERNDSDKKLYIKFEVSDIYSYYSGYKLILKDNGKVEGEIPIPDITKNTVLSLESYSKPQYTVELIANSSMPSDRNNNINQKTVYSAIIKN